MTDLCANCQQRQATLNWVGEGGTLGFVHGMYQRWCEVCATTAQLKYAREQAAMIPALELKLAGLGVSDPPSAPRRDE